MRVSCLCVVYVRYVSTLTLCVCKHYAHLSYTIVYVHTQHTAQPVTESTWMHTYLRMYSNLVPTFVRRHSAHIHPPRPLADSQICSAQQPRVCTQSAARVFPRDWRGAHARTPFRCSVDLAVKTCAQSSRTHTHTREAHAEGCLR